MNVLEEARELVAAYKSEDMREQKFAAALVKLLDLQTLDPETGELSGPALNFVSISRDAGLSRNLINQSLSACPTARELIVSVLALLKDGNLRTRCDYLEVRVKTLERQLDEQRSVSAGLMLKLKDMVKARADAGEGTRGKADAQSIRTAVNIIPIEVAMVGKKPQ